MKKNYFICKDKKRAVRGYETLDNLEELSKYIDDIGILLFHSCTDADLYIYRFFGMLKDKKPTAIIYSNNELNYSLVSIIEALNGDVYNNEDILNDKNTLSFCISKYNKSPLALRDSTSDMQRLSRFIEDIKGDSSKALAYVNNPMWIAALNKSVKRVSFELQRYEKATEQMVTVVHNIDDTMQSLEKSSSEQQEELVKLATNLKTMEDKYKEALVQQSQENTNKLANELLHNKNTLSTFPAYQAKPSIAYTAYIQVKKSCPYLLSFLLSFIQAMKMQKKKNVKLLLLLPKGKTWIKYHDEFTALTPDNLKFCGNTIMDKVGYWTADPTSKFWDYVLNEKHNADGYIVVDYIMDEPLLLGSKVTYMRAGLGKGFLTAEGPCDIPITHTFFSLEGDPQGIVLKTIEGYADLKPAMRGNKYFTEYRDTAYPRMAQVLHLV